MKVEEKKEVIIELTLSQDEAQWLKSFVQNSYTEEDSQYAQYRFDLFNSLKDALS